MTLRVRFYRRGREIFARKWSWRCEFCGEGFTSAYRGKRFCSSKCCRRNAAMLKSTPCVDCGRVLRSQATRCAACNAARYANAPLTERQTTIVYLWSRGRTAAEIARAIESTANAVGVTVCQLRARGIDVPYRYPMHKGRRVAA